MEPDAKYTLVGAAVLLLVGSAVVATLWLTNLGHDEGYDPYVVYFQRHSLAGLQVDSPVTMRGIPIGRVRGLRIASPDVERVRVLLHVDQETPVKADTRAVIQRNLLTGLASIDLVGSTRESKSLLPREEGEPPVIPEGSSQFEAITSDLPKLFEQLNVVASGLADFLNEDNKRSVTAILNNIELLTQAVADEDGNVKRLVRDLSELSSSLTRFTAQLDERTNEISKSLAATSDVVALETQSVSRDLSRAARALVATLERFQNPASIVAGPPPHALGPGERAGGGR